MRVASLVDVILAAGRMDHARCHAGGGPDAIDHAEANGNAVNMRRSTERNRETDPHRPRPLCAPSASSQTSHLVP